MPSPIAHTTMGYIIHKIYRSRTTRQNPRQLGPLSPILLVTTGLSLLPDFDSAVGILLRDFGRYHNNGSHSLFVGLAVAVGIGAMVQWRKRSGFVYWFVLVSLCYQFHIILDFFTVGRGVMLFWPLSLVRFASPIKLFYGLHWSDGFVSIKHLWTLLNEVGYAAVVIWSLHFLERKRDYFRPIRPSFNQPPGDAPERS